MSFIKNIFFGFRKDFSRIKYPKWTVLEKLFWVTILFLVIAVLYFLFADLLISNLFKWLNSGGTEVVE